MNEIWMIKIMTFIKCKQMRPWSTLSAPSYQHHYYYSIIILFFNFTTIVVSFTLVVFSIFTVNTFIFFIIFILTFYSYISELFEKSFSWVKGLLETVSLPRKIGVRSAYIPPSPDPLGRSHWVCCHCRCRCRLALSTESYESQPLVLSWENYSRPD